MKVALYARVSTKDKEQDPETQLMPLRRYCQEKGFEIYNEYKDYESGRNSERKRLTELKKDAMYRKFDAVLVWKMDRLSRGGIRDTFNQIDYFKQHRIPVISLTEQYLSTDQPSAELILAVLAWAAEQESKRIGERVKAGIARVRAEKGKWGRYQEINKEEVIKLRKQGKSFREIAKELKISVGSAHRICKEASQALRKSCLQQQEPSHSLL